MPSLNQLPGEMKRKKLTKALVRLGFVLNEKGGNGSHYKILWPKNQKSVTLPYDLNKHTLYYLLKEIETMSGITWDDIQKQL